MNSNGAKFQAWITPALLGAALILLMGIWSEVRETRASVNKAMITLGKHETVLIMNGLMEPRRLSK